MSIQDYLENELNKAIRSGELKSKHNSLVSFFKTEIKNLDTMRRINNLTRPLIAYQQSRSGLAGQAFTNWKCLRCDAEHVYPNTMVPFICNDCIGDVKKLYEEGYFNEVGK